jgi:hypothetical protein
MDTVLSRSTVLTFGHSNQKDPFQRGREAAQMAKLQLHDAPPNLILSFGPSTAHFQDFIEGVRLVTGEAGLVAFSSHHVFTNDLYMATGGLVVLLQSDTLHFSVGAATIANSNYSAAFTSLITQHRQQRGNICHQYEFRGMLVVDNASTSEHKKLIDCAAVEGGLEGWAIGISPLTARPLPLLCDDKVVQKGLVGIECLSVNPVGISSVSVEAFGENPSVYREAVKSAVREARSQMTSEPAAGLLLFDFPMEMKTAQDLQTLFRQDESPFRNCPMVGLATDGHSVKLPHRAGTVLNQSVVAMLLPL